VDVHAVTASGIFGVPPEKVTPEQRAVGKTVNFATIYGQSAFGLSKQLKIGIAVAQEYIDNYFKRYPCVMKYRSHAIGDAKKSGFVETLFGRRRYFPEINSSAGFLQKEAERMAVNMPIQGTSADFIKLAMVLVDKALEENGLKDKVFMLLQIHDELLFEIRNDAIGTAVPIIKKAMESVYPLEEKDIELVAEQYKKINLPEVPTEVKVEAGDNWDEMKEL